MPRFKFSHVFILLKVIAKCTWVRSCVIINIILYSIEEQLMYVLYMRFSVQRFLLRYILKLTKKQRTTVRVIDFQFLFAFKGT